MTLQDTFLWYVRNFIAVFLDLFEKIMGFIPRWFRFLTRGNLSYWVNVFECPVCLSSMHPYAQFSIQSRRFRDCETMQAIIRKHCLGKSIIYSLDLCFSCKISYCNGFNFDGQVPSSV